VPLVADATSQCITHLRDKYSIGPSSLIQRPASILEQLGPAPAPIFTPVSKQELVAETFIDNYINWVVEEDITFSQASSARLKKLIALSGSETAALIPSANTVKAWILKACTVQREEVKNSLKTAQGRISLSWDLWSTTNDLSLLGVCAHWIDALGAKREVLIGLPRVRSHYGSDIAAVLHTVIEVYGIGNNLGAFQGDNATNNDTTVAALCEWYSIDITEQRLRCLGYVINLVVQSLLYGENLSGFKKELDGTSDLSQFKVWRKQGAISKLYNLVYYICRSKQRTSVFNDLQREHAEQLKESVLRLKRDTGVRWNSTYTMIKRALRLRATLDAYRYR
jgi:hypothetical protein